MRDDKDKAATAAAPALAPTLATVGAASAPAVSLGGSPVYIPTSVRRTLVLTAAFAVWLVLVDAAVAVVALPLSYWLRQGQPVLVWPVGQPSPVDVVNGFRPYVSLMFAAPIVLFLALKYYGLYRLRGEFTFLGDAFSLFKAVTVSSLVLVLIAFLYRGGYVWHDYSYSRGVLLWDWAIVLVTCSAMRSALRAAQIAYRSHERNLIPTLIVGDGELAEYVRDGDR